VSRAQRLTFLALAVAIALVALVVLSSGGDDDEPESTASQAAPTATATAGSDATPEPAETETPTPTPTPKPQPPLLEPGDVKTLRFDQGDTVRFRVRADTTDEVHVHGYDLVKDIEPGKTIAFNFDADITGIFEIELEDAGEEIGRLRVDPD